MQFQVPQFIDVEDTIVGPLTWKQFVYLLAAGGSAFILTRVLPTWLGFIVAIPVVGFFLALAFYKINGRPFIYAIESAISYYIGARLYVWKQPKAHAKTSEEIAKEKQEKDTAEFEAFANVPKLTTSRLKDLSWSLDVLDLQKQKEK